MAKPDPTPPADRVERPRPTDMSEEQLGFCPQPAVRWLAPITLIKTGAQSLVAGIFGAYADKRELQASLRSTMHRDRKDDPELWLDFVADVGDGFDATFSVASLLAADEVRVPAPDGTRELPRGRLLVMGGDQAYPAASTANYEDRTKGVYRAAMPVAKEDKPTLFALPGNHDWYDGLTAFLRVFAQQRSFGGWATAQTRSYFAMQLPRRWWLFAIDTQFDDYVDGPQLEYFRAAAENMLPGDAVILCTPKPAWVPAGSGGKSKGYDTIEFFQREIVRKKKAFIRLMVSGDAHHYARYLERGGDRQLITCGLGGAYLAATHELPSPLELPPPMSRVRHPGDPTTFDLVSRYPAEEQSKRLATGIFRLPWRNTGFWRLTGIAQTALTLAVLFGLGETTRSGPLDLFGLLAVWTPAAIVALVLALGGMAFARIDLPKTNKTNNRAGLLHAGAHMLLSFGWAVLVLWLYRDVLPDDAVGDWVLFAILVLVTPFVIGFIDAEVVAVYLLVASRHGINLNEAFAGQSIEDHKGFLRMHIDPDGTLTLYPIKLPTVCRRWRANPAGRPTDPWLLPDGEELRPELIEEPIRIPRVSETAAGTVNA